MVSGAPERGERPSLADRRSCAHGVDLAGRYRVGSLVRTDGRACIHEGRDVLLQRAVSVTLATPERGIPIPRTLPLPTSAQQGHGPGLGEIYDGGDDQGTLYLITQAHEGATLAQELSRHHLAADEVRDLGAGIARALLPAHRRGWAHGGLEADTVALGPDRVTVAGLGVGEWLAHWAQVEDRPRYPAPEQLAEQEISPATDVFALGALLAEAAEPLPSTDPLSVLLARMRADDPAERPSTEEVLHLLQAPDGTDASPPDARQVAVVRRRSPDGRTAPTVTALGGLAVASALALATFLVHTSDASPERVVGGATVAASSADPILPGPLPLLIPPLARQAMAEERTHPAPVTRAATADRYRAAAPLTRSTTAPSSREERGDVTAHETPAADTGSARTSSARTSSADPSSADTSSADTTAPERSTRPTRSDSPRPPSTTDAEPSSTERTRTKTPTADDGAGVPTGTHRPGPTVHGRGGVTATGTGTGTAVDSTSTRTITATVTDIPATNPDSDEAGG